VPDNDPDRPTPISLETDDRTSIAEIRFGLVLRLAALLKVVGAIVLVVLAIAAFYNYRRYSNVDFSDTPMQFQPIAEILLPSLANALVSGFTLAFFGFALELGVELYQLVFDAGFGNDGDDHDPEPDDPSS
jgi:hypothetical protein